MCSDRYLLGFFLSVLQPVLSFSFSSLSSISLLYADSEPALDVSVYIYLHLPAFACSGESRGWLHGYQQIGLPSSMQVKRSNSIRMSRPVKCTSL